MDATTITMTFQKEIFHKDRDTVELIVSYLKFRLCLTTVSNIMLNIVNWCGGVACDWCGSLDIVLTIGIK